MRLNKYLATAGVASRRKADALIAEGRVKVNGTTVTNLGTIVDMEDLVELDSAPVQLVQEKLVYLLHKPPGVISTVTDPRGRKTVMDLIHDPRRLFPIGRLDRDTTGALLITNDGELANRLSHPRYGIEKHYLAEVKGRLTSRSLIELSKGIVLSEGIRIQARLTQVAVHGKRTIYQIVLTEGKNREIKRIFRHYRLPLVRLHRSSFAGLSADHLAPGKSRPLKRSEVKMLYELISSREDIQAPEKQMDIHAL